MAGIGRKVRNNIPSVHTSAYIFRKKRNITLYASKRITCSFAFCSSTSSFARHRVTMSSSYSKESIARTGRDKKSWSYRVTSTGLFVSGVERKGEREIIFGGDNLSVAIERRHFSSGLSLVQVHSWRARTGVRRITRSAAYAHIYTFIYIYVCIYTQYTYMYARTYIVCTHATVCTYVWVYMYIGGVCRRWSRVSW